MLLGEGWERKRRENQNTTPMVIIKYWNIKTSFTLFNRFLNKSNSSEIFAIPLFELWWQLYLAEEKPSQSLWLSLCCIPTCWRRDSLPSKQLYHLWKSQCDVSYTVHTHRHTQQWIYAFWHLKGFSEVMEALKVSAF